MDARPVPAPATARESSRSRLAPSELGPVLAYFGRGLDRPLAALRSGLAALTADPAVMGRDDLRAQVGLMHDLGAGLSGLSRDYFDFTAVTEGVLAPRPQPTRLAELLQSIDLPFAPEAARRGIAWECRLDGPDVVVATDPAWCRRLLGGLVSNALRFTPPGGRVSLTASRNGSGWSLTVRDTGRGLPAGMSLREIQPFRRDREVFERSEGEPQGNRLGLPLVLALVARLGGRCSFGSEPGRRTCVEVHFSEEPGSSPS